MPVIVCSCSCLKLLATFGIASSEGGASVEKFVKFGAVENSHLLHMHTSKWHINVSQADADVLEGRKRLQAKWDEWRETRKEYAKELADGQRKILEEFYDLSQVDDYSIEEVETETQLSNNEEVIKNT